MLLLQQVLYMEKLSVRIESLKGKIIFMDEHILKVLSDKTNSEHIIKRDKSKNYQIGQIVNMIIQESEFIDKPVNIVSENNPHKRTVSKMINFSSLINQMNKFHDRLTQNLDDAIASDADEEAIRNISEKRDYLEKGIDLFTKQ